jgi:hypothetical protein
VGSGEIQRATTEKLLEKGKRYALTSEEEPDMTMTEVEKYLHDNTDRILGLPPDHIPSKEVLRAVYMYKRAKSDITEVELRKAVAKLRRDLEGE